MKRSALNAQFCLPLLQGLTGCLDWDDEEDLGVRIQDVGSAELVFEKQVGQFGAIIVSN